MTVGLVLVSHSALIAEGLVGLARQMAPDVPLVPAGGTDDGGIGTSAALIEAGVRGADAGDGVVLIADLGSAVLTAETVAELMEDPPAAGVRVLDVPLVEGGVAAAVAAQAGAPIEGVVRAAQGAAGPGAGQEGLGPAGRGAAEAPEEQAEAPEEHADAARVTLQDPEGLHARPAAELARLAAGFDAAVTVDGADARGLLAVLALGLRRGAEVDVRATGPDRRAALAAVVHLLGGAR